MRYLGILVGACLAATVCACVYYSLPTHIRYRLSLYVEADGVEYHGSGVIETDWFNQTFMSGLAQGIEWTIHTHGEAVAVDMGSRGVVFALLKGIKLKTARSNPGFYYPEDPEMILLNAFPPPPPRRITAGYVRTLAHRHELRELGADDLPMLVRFRDINDPASVERVDPQDMTASLGQGVRLVRATLTITGEAVTRGIDQRLTWLRGLHGGYLPGQQASASRQMYGMLYAGHFQRP